MTTYTHLEFRRRFTPAEQELSDELEATFESSGLLSAEQKRKLRTGYRNFYAATVVDMDDPAIPPMLGLYEALGLLAPGRAADILSEPAESVAVDAPAFVQTHTVTLAGVPQQACVDPDGTVRFDDGKWSTLEALAAMGAEVVEVV